MKFNEQQEQRGAVLVAPAFGVNPNFLRSLALALGDIDTALDIAERAQEARLAYLTEDGEVDQARINEKVEAIQARYLEFHEEIRTSEEIEDWVDDGYGKEGVDWEWQKTTFGRKRRKIKK